MYIMPAIQPSLFNKDGHPVANAIPYEPSIDPEQAALEETEARRQLLEGRPLPTEADKQVGKAAIQGMRQGLQPTKPSTNR